MQLPALLALLLATAGHATKLHFFDANADANANANADANADAEAEPAQPEPQPSNSKFDNLLPNFDSLTSKFDNLLKPFDSLTSKFDNLLTPFDSLTSQFDNLMPQDDAFEDLSLEAVYKLITNPDVATRFLVENSLDVLITTVGWIIVGLLHEKLTSSAALDLFTQLPEALKFVVNPQTGLGALVINGSVLFILALLWIVFGHFDLVNLIDNLGHERTARSVTTDMLSEALDGSLSWKGIVESRSLSLLMFVAMQIFWLFTFLLPKPEAEEVTVEDMETRRKRSAERSAVAARVLRSINAANLKYEQ